MLSEDEYQQAKRQLQNMSSTIKGKYRASLRRTLRQKIKEHEYITQYEPFTPSPYTLYFVNRTTTEKILNQLIQAAKTSTEFLLDTESINIYLQENKPVLIQLQIILPDKPSFIIIVEMYHLPPDDGDNFKLIEQLFTIVLSNDKKLYIWGSKEEMYPFVIFELFTREQVYQMDTIDLQKEFKKYYNQQHPHQSSSSTTTTNNTCKCEQCFGKQLTETWSLQDAVVVEFREYLTKQLTNEDFHLGLDPNLYQMNQEELHHRQQLTTYASYDCLSMERILAQMDNNNYIFNINPVKYVKINYFDANELLPISSDEDDNLFLITKYDEPSAPSITILKNQHELSLNKEEELSMTHPPTSTIPTSTKLHRSPPDWESVSSNNDNSNLIGSTSQHTTTHHHHHDQPEPTEPREELTREQRRIIHNRSCTTRQRRRYYRRELIFKNIDHRFKIKQIKSILQQHQISFYVVNTTTSRTTNKRTLFVAIRDISSIRNFEQTRHFFTKTHYDELKASGQLPRFRSSRHNRRQQHRHRSSDHDYHQQHRSHLSRYDHRQQYRSRSPRHDYHQQHRYHSLHHDRRRD